jgi:hypothetical protein
MEDNQATWLEVLDVAFKGRFQVADIPTLFVAILDRMAIENKARNASQEDISLYHDAIQWAKHGLLKVAEVPDTLSSSFPRRKYRNELPRRNLYTVLSDRALFDPGDAKNLDISMLRYPVPGFMVIIRLLRDQGDTNEQLQTYLFQRLMFHLTEGYFSGFKEGAQSDVALSIDRLLYRDTIAPLPKPQQHISNGEVVTVSIDTLLRNNLLDSETLRQFQTMDEFKAVQQQMGPATAVYLHALSVHGSMYLSPVDYFNAVKINSSINKVISMPLAISEGLSADLIERIRV